MISAPTDTEKYLIYTALVRAIETNSGLGFHNSDQGHPAYRAGAKDGDEVDPIWGDSPEKNELFKLLLSFETLHKGETGPDLSTWQKFCAFAVDAYDREHNPSGG